MRKVFRIFALAFLVMALCSCNGYNPIMYKHLCDLQSYVTVSGVVDEIFFYDAEWDKIIWENSADEIPESEYIMNISLHFEDEEDYLGFFGGSSLPEGYDFSADIWTFEIISTNVDVLVENGFFDAIFIGDEIRIVTSNWIYMDGNFFEIIELEHNDTVYLNSSDGLENFIEYMEKNKSWF